MGTSLGVFSSSSNPVPSSVVANTPTSIGTTSMTLNGSVTNMGHLTTVQFEWGTSPTLSSYTTSSATQSPVSTSGTSSFSRQITGLSPNTNYYFRVVTTTAGVQVRSSIVAQSSYGIPVWSDNSLSRTRVNVAYSDSVLATGTPTPTYAVTSGALPTGLLLDPITGAVTGTTTSTDEFSFTITASNAAGSVNQSYTILVSTGIEGGTETNGSGVRIHRFYGAGSITNYIASAPRSVLCYLISGGGAGGSSVGGGGGAGRFVGGTFYIAQNTSISCTVGAGGARQTSFFGGQGSDGTASTLTTPTISGYQTGTTFTYNGGGGGGFYNANAPTAGTTATAPGGSGGGGSGGVGGASSLGGGGYTSGGRGQTFTNGRYVAGGGGGYGTSGTDGNASDGTSGRGGEGGYLTYTGSYYAAGGGGGGDAIASVSGTGDVAGTSGNTTGNNGTAFTGGGGGGCRNASGGVASGAGGSGLVMFIYAR